MSTPKKMYIDEIAELARRLKPIVGSTADKLWKLFLHSDSDDEYRENRALLQLLALKEKTLDFEQGTILPPPASKLLPERFHIGEVMYPDRRYGTFGLSERDLTRHVLIVGMTGAGKTNLCLHLISQLARHNIPFLIFDWKMNYRKLRGQPGLESLRVIRPEDPDCNFHFNPLIPPPGISAKHWMGLIVDVIKHSFYVLFGPEYFFRKGIHELYQRKGIYDGGRDYPTFIELEKLLKSEFVRGRELLWMSSVKRVLNALGKMGILGHVVNVPYSNDLEEIMKSPTIFELDGLPTLERVFFTETLLLWIYHYRKHQGPSTGLRHAILLEEAHHLLSAKKEKIHGEESIIESMVRMAREFGEGFIIVDQEPNKLSRSVLANTGCKISMSLGNGWDIKAMSEAMCLRIQERPYLGKLGIGSAIATLSSRFKEPILIQCPLFRLDANSLQFPERRDNIYSPLG